jgi:hypothetical protein
MGIAGRRGTFIPPRTRAFCPHVSPSCALLGRREDAVLAMLWRRRVPRCGATAAGARLKGSPKRPSRHSPSGAEAAGLCPLTFEASPKRWTERAKTSVNSHCGPTEGDK